MKSQSFLPTRLLLPVAPVYAQRHGQGKPPVGKDIRDRLSKNQDNNVSHWECDGPKRYFSRFAHTIDPVFSVTEVMDEDDNSNFPFHRTGTNHPNDSKPGAGTVYTSRGEAKGLMVPTRNQTLTNYRRPGHPPQRINDL